MGLNEMIETDWSEMKAAHYVFYFIPFWYSFVNLYTH